jgi:hypothetical protein
MGDDPSKEIVPYRSHRVGGPASGKPASGIPAKGSRPPFTPGPEGTGKQAGELAAELARQQKFWMRQGYLRGMAEGARKVAHMQSQEIEHILQNTEPGSPERQKFLTGLGEKILDRVIDKSTQRVESDVSGTVGIDVARRLSQQTQ